MIEDANRLGFVAGRIKNWPSDDRCGRFLPGGRGLVWVAFVAVLLSAVGAQAVAGENPLCQVYNHVYKKQLKRVQAEDVEALLENGADINGKCATGLDIRSPLMVHVSASSAAVVSVLVRYGGDVNQPDTSGQTPLIAAAMSGNADTLKVLLDAGAEVNASPPMSSEYVSSTRELAPQFFQGTSLSEVNARGGWGTALMWAARFSDNTEALQVLLDYGADIEAKWIDGETITHFSALDNPSPEVVSFVIALTQGKQVNEETISGATPLEQAVYFNLNPAEIVKVLVCAGADANVRNGENHVTPLMTALIPSFAPPILAKLIPKDAVKDTVEVLLRAGADINAQSKSGETALMIAVGLKQLDAARVLMEYGADASIADKDGNTVDYYLKKTGQSADILAMPRTKTPPASPECSG